MAKVGFRGDVSPQGTWEALAHDPKAVLLDVRTLAEWSFVGKPDLSSLDKPVHHIEWMTFPGMALNPDFIAEFKSLALDAAQPIYLICRSGVRSRAAAELIANEGYETYNVADGFEGQISSSGHRGVGGWRAFDLPWKQS